MYNDIKSYFERRVKEYAKKASGYAEYCFEKNGMFTIYVNVPEYDRPVIFMMKTRGGKITVLANGRKYQL